ncbi:MAG: hypothetical protein ACE368_13435 [Paracoccaceae bacterium]
MYLLLENAEVEDWVSLASSAPDSSVVSLKKGRQVDCLAISLDMAPGKPKQVLKDAKSLVEAARNPVHGVAFRSFSVLERVLLIYGESKSPCVHFDCTRYGNDQEKFDLECHIDAADSPDEPIVAFLGASIRKQDIDPEEPIRIMGKVDLVRGVKDDLEEAYSLLYK